MSEQIIALTMDSFADEVLESDVSVVVDFWADWCGPCRMLAPVLEQVAEEAGAGRVFKINVDEQMELATAYGVRSIPTLIRFAGGEETGRLVGVQSKEQILEFLGVQ